jgi:hypothetical protein
MLFLPGLTWAGGPGELSLLAGYTESKYVDRVESNTQSLAVRYVHGGAVNFRIELPVLRARSSANLLGTGAGPVSFDYQYVDSSGSGGNGGNGNGGSSSGGSASSGPTGGSWDDEWRTGIGDILLAADHLVAGGGIRLFHLDAGLQVKAPIADDEKGLGTGEWDFRAGVSGEYRFWSVTAFGGAGWNRLGDPSWIELNDVWDGYLGLEGYAFGERVVIAGWIDGHEEIVEQSGARNVIGLELRTAKSPSWRIALTAEVGADGEGFGVMLGRSFSSGGSSGYRGVLR